MIHTGAEHAGVPEEIRPKEMSMTRDLRAAGKFLILTLWSMLFLLPGAAARLRRGRFRRAAKLTRLWARGALKILGGKVDVSGGEPLVQGEFLIELLKGAKEHGLHTCIETCGFGKSEILKEVAKYTDIFLFDIKETDDARHKELTGVPFTPIKENLFLLNSLGAKIVLRCPLVPDINTRDEHYHEIAKIASELDNLLEVNVMAYHLLGNSKYDALEMENKMRGHEAMSAEQKAECIKAISQKITEISAKTVKVC